MFVLYNLKPLSIDILNPPLHTQHNKGVRGNNEGNANAAIRLLGGGLQGRKNFQQYIVTTNKLETNLTRTNIHTQINYK